MEKPMKITTGVLGFLTAVLWLLNGGRREGILLSLAITASTAFYHLSMRLAVGAAVNARMHNRADCFSPWFRPRAFEPGLYALLRVKRWKGKMPTYVPGLFDRKQHSLEQIAQAMCQAEVVHEVIAVLSFLPILAAGIVGSLPVFLITSLLAALLDLSFAVIQRYNRPRVLRLLEKAHKNSAAGSC